MMDRLRTDLVSVIRTLCAAPAIPVATVVTVAAAVGINLAMLGLIDRALLSPPPHIVQSERVFTVTFEHLSRAGGERALTATTSYQTFETIRDRVPGITTAAAWHYIPTSASIDGERFPLKAVAVSGAYFAMLEVRPRLGRTIVPDDDRQLAGSPGAVLSHSLWKRAFAGDEQVVGRRFSLHGREDFRVIGVMPAGFSGHSAERADLWVPLRAAMNDVARGDPLQSMNLVEVGVRLSADSNPVAVSSH